MVYTTTQACKKLEIPHKTLKSRMATIAKAGHVWRTLGRMYYIDDKELLLLAKVPLRGSKPGVKKAVKDNSDYVDVPDAA